MKIILAQQIQSKEISKFADIQKTYKSSIIPHTGDFITDRFYSEPYEYEIGQVVINYEEGESGECTVTIKPYVLDTNNIEVLEQQIECAEKHGWKATKSYTI